MGLDRHFWKDAAGRASACVWGAIWAVAPGLLAVVLVAQAARAGRERTEIRRRGEALDREVERVRRGNQALRDEVRALQTDPVYIESLLRRWKMAGSGERVVE